MSLGSYILILAGTAGLTLGAMVAVTLWYEHRMRDLGRKHGRRRPR